MCVFCISYGYDPYGSSSGLAAGTIVAIVVPIAIVVLLCCALGACYRRRVYSQPYGATVYGPQPNVVVADSGYGTGSMLGAGALGAVAGAALAGSAYRRPWYSFGSGWGRPWGYGGGGWGGGWGRGWGK